MEVLGCATPLPVVRMSPCWQPGHLSLLLLEHITKLLRQQAVSCPCLQVPKQCHHHKYCQAGNRLHDSCLPSCKNRQQGSLGGSALWAAVLSRSHQGQQQQQAEEQQHML
jgi:hypothetical protein